MKFWLCAIFAWAFFASLLLTGFMRRIAVSFGVIDTPNERSSHAIPTPRGGGVGIVVSSLSAIGILVAMGIVSANLFIAIAGGGIGVALAGLLDDYRTLSPRTRLAVHLISAAWAVFWVGPAEFVQPGVNLGLVKVLEAIVSTVGIAWCLNIFNFMDGIDGIAASEATFLCVATALFGVHSGGFGLAAVALVLGASSAGFLFWNLPPARIFMGDVGSGYVGFILGVVAVYEINHGLEELWTWLILAGIFVVDSTITLARRTWRREALASAHRMHAYQHAAAWFGHARVTATVTIINVAWLLPMAVASVLRPKYEVEIMVVALVPVAGAAIFFGAGRRDFQKMRCRGD